MDFAPNVTARVKMNYRVQGLDHSLMLRAPFTATYEDAQDVASKIIALLNTLTTQRYSDFAALGYEWCPAAGDVWYPVVPAAGPALATGAVSTSGRPDSQAAAQLRFEARSTIGSKASYTVFGTNWVPGATAAVDFRIAASENPAISAFITGLTEIAPETNAIDGGPIVPKLYANVKYNDAILKRLRGI